QRRQGRRARPYTHVCSPGRRTPVVTWPDRSLFASISRWARPTSASRPATSRTGRHGSTPRRNSTSALYRLPIPINKDYSQEMDPIDIYARVSRKGDKEQRSIGSQVAACRAILQERG